MLRPRKAPLAAALAAALALFLCACAGPRPLRLTIAHLNDTHSALEPSDEALSLRAGGETQAVRAGLGGMARLKGALDAARAEEPGLILLHAGDAVQGTLYFNAFGGRPEFELLNALGVDAMCPGNHEFDRGPRQLAEMLALARFPIVAANIDASEEPVLAGRWRPYAILRVRGTDGPQEVGVIGATTPQTPHITAGADGTRFGDPAPAIRRAVEELAARGVDKIILLSHNGYEEDQALARAVAGLDVIVGGHSHTLLGEAAPLAALGLRPEGPYPTVVTGPDGGVTLVVQAWKWGEVLGRISVDFDARGRVTGHSAAPALVMTGSFSSQGQAVDPASPRGEALRAAAEASGFAVFPPEDPAVRAMLAPLKRQVDALQNAPLGASLATDQVRGSATDPGPLVADACLAAAPMAQVALMNQGGLRRDLPAGPLTRGQVAGLLPFGNTLVVLEVSGAQLKDALEEALELQLAARPGQRAGQQARPPHPAGFTYSVHPSLPRGQRVSALARAADATPIRPGDRLALVVNSFLAGGGDGMDTLRAAARRTDTGVLDADALAEHLLRLGAAGPVRPPAGARVRLTD